MSDANPNESTDILYCMGMNDLEGLPSPGLVIAYGLQNIGYTITCSASLDDLARQIKVFPHPKACIVGAKPVKSDAVAAISDLREIWSIHDRLEELTENPNPKESRQVYSRRRILCHNLEQYPLSKHDPDAIPIKLGDLPIPLMVVYYLGEGHYSEEGIPNIAIAVYHQGKKSTLLHNDFINTEEGITKDWDKIFQRQINHAISYINGIPVKLSHLRPLLTELDWVGKGTREVFETPEKSATLQHVMQVAAEKMQKIRA